jgi:hypothetical protein
MLPVHLPRLKAPRNHGELLAYPPLDAVGELLRDNRVRFGGTLLGRPLTELRDVARSEILAAARDYLVAAREPVPAFSALTWLVAGHQPELFHPGVWIKNFILQALANRHGATPLNLVVDNDVAKAATLRVPGEERAHVVPFDVDGGESPFEERCVKDENLFQSFDERMRPLTRAWPFRPWLDDVWAEMRRVAPSTTLLGERIVRVRRALERSMGLRPLEVPLSAVCRTEAFAWFACSLVADLPRFVENYNAAVHDYRWRHDLKSKNHPVPDLTRQGEALEAPFWVWRAEAPRRQRLFAVRDGGGAQLFAGATPFAHLRGQPAEWVEQWRALERQGIKIRTRALTTTLFSRLVLADLFLHGIGGGKYDEVTDDIVRRYYERETPHYLVVTATLLLPFPRVPGLEERLREVHRKERDLWCNPQRHLPAPSAEGERLAAHKNDALAMPQFTHEQRVARFQRLLQATADLRPSVARPIEDLKRQRDDIQKRWRHDEVIAARDYSFCLYPEELLRSYLPNESPWRKT